MNPAAAPTHIIFEATPEIFATDASGTFTFPLVATGKAYLSTQAYDEVRLVASLWHPSEQHTIDLDRAYVELRASFSENEEHWARIAEIEPVVPPYAGSQSFDGWIVLPVMGTTTALALAGSGFEPRARLQIRASAYFVA